MEIVLVKQTDEHLSEDDKAVVRRFLFEHLSGATEKDTRSWTRFVRALDQAGSGEFFTITVKRQRNGRFHCMHMALISKVFKAQERLDDFEQFRLYLKVGSGFVTWMAGPKGGVFPVPRSINFNTCSEEDMREFHYGVIAFLRTAHAQRYIWPNVAPSLAAEGVETILNSFERT